MNEFRVGFGQDVHRLVVGRPLILGGVAIPHEKGLDGHSDADVLTHAIMDALLGAAGLGDIGEHFPDDDLMYKDISSLVLLRKVGDMLRQAGFFVQYIDATVAAQAPKISPYKGEMETKLAYALELTESQINIKATTHEGLGFVGRHEGIVAFAVTTLARNAAHNS